MHKLTILFALLTLSAGLWAQNTEPNTLPTPANNQIFYRSSDHQKITPNNPNAFGAAYNDAQSTYNTEEDYGIITFDGNITTIGDWAFSGKNTLTAVVWPSTATSIGESAFQNCTNLSTIDLQEGVTSIGDYAFGGCAVEELTIPSTVTNIGEAVFSGCTNLTKLIVKARSIGVSAFQKCTNLSSIDLQEGVTSIGGWAFQGCAVEELTIPSTVTNIGNRAFTDCKALTKLTVKAGNIGIWVFNGCTNLSTIDLQEGVTSIERYAFAGCAGISELILPSSVTSIGEFAFSGCTSLTKLTVKAGSIGKNAFEGCTKLSIVDLQEGITSIKSSAFNGCVGMSELTIPSTVTSIEIWTFNGCTNLSTIHLQEGLTSIEASAFNGCSGIEELIIPSTVNTIGDDAFNGCSNVTSVTFLGYVVVKNAFSGVGTVESPANLKIPSTWLASDKPVDSTTPWHGGYFNCEYVNPLKEFLGDMAEPCEDCPAVEVSDGTTTVTLYNPKNVQFKKIQQEQ